MKVQTSSNRIPAGCELLVLLVAASELQGAKSKSLPSSLAALSGVDPKLPAGIDKILKREDFKGKAGQQVLVRAAHLKNPQAILVVGWEKKGNDLFDQLDALRKLGSLICKTAQTTASKQVALTGTAIRFDTENQIQALIEGIQLTRYTFTKYKKKESKDKNFLDLLVIHTKYALSSRIVRRSLLISEAANFARDLVNTPARDCTTQYLVKRCRALAKKNPALRLQVMDKSKLRSMGANLLLAVGQASDQPPYLIKLTYKPRNAKRVISIVGKGITFDSGGLSIKTGSGMETMKMDMAGAAAVIGAMQAISALKPNVEVRAYIPTAENMINGAATRPGDVVTGLAGKSVEILNTDAEGRLILADALALAVRDKCDFIVDLATLTGACMVALGPDYAGLFSNNSELVDRILDAADLSGELFWEMPLAEEYKSMLKSPIADIKNTGGRWGGAITAALFLNAFVGDAAWAHIDLAGPAFSESESGYRKKGATGFGVRTLVHLAESFG